jgi:hypothetical protein
MKYKVAELRGARLDQAVAKALGFMFDAGMAYMVVTDMRTGARRLVEGATIMRDGKCEHFSPSSVWTCGGPILEDHWNHCLERLEEWLGQDWMLHIDSTQHSLLRVFMQALVMWQLDDDEVELP